MHSIHPLDECTFIINGSFPFTGLSSDADERQAVKQTSVVASSSSSSSSLSPPSAEHDRPDGKLRGETSAARVQRIKEPDNSISSSNNNNNNNDLHVIPEQPEDPCVVSGRVDVPQNWFGYLGVFRLRRSDAPSPASLSPARLYYRVVYPAGRVPVSLLFYLGEQVRSLNVRMNCFQRVQLVDQRGPQVVRLDPGFPQSGCVNRTRTAADAHVTSREDRRTGSDASLSKTVIDCRGGRVLRSNVERQWNIAVSSCGSPRGLTLTYTLAVYGHIGQCPPSPGLSGADCIYSTRLSCNELFLSMLLTKFIAMISLSS